MAFTDKLAAIADAIRAKTGTTDGMTLDQMPSAIASIETGGDYTVLEGIELELYLADGDQPVSVPDGYVVKSAIIKKPATLIPENIAKDVEIAGVVGTHAGGGGGSVEGYATVTFMNGGEVLFSRMVLKGDDCPDPWVQKRIETPTKESTAQYDYTFNGWATADGGSADSNALKGITEDKTLYAAYTESVRMYTVNFYDGDTLLTTEQVPYGGSSSYVHKKDDYIFIGWTPSPTNVSGDMDCYGTWEESVAFADISWEKISQYSKDGTASSRFALGDTKVVTLTHSDGTTEDISVQIVGFNHDKAEDGSTVGISFACYSMPKELSVFTGPSGANRSGYVSFWVVDGTKHYSTVGNLCVGEIYNSLPPSLKSAIVPVKKNVNHQNGSVSDGASVVSICDPCWLLSSVELGGAVSSLTMPEADKATYATAYAYFSGASTSVLNTRRKRYIDGVATDYWLRDYSKAAQARFFSGNSSGKIFATGWCSDNPNDESGWVKKGVCFGFAV